MTGLSDAARTAIFRSPLLRAHHCAGALFSVSGKMWPVSVAAQMTRAAMLVDELHDRRVLVRGGTLVVIGGGAAAMTVTAVALARGFNVTVVRKDEGWFSTLAPVRTRQVSPTLCDWPAPHYLAGHFSLSGDPAMPWRHAEAAAVVEELQTELMNLVGAKAPNVNFLEKVDTVSLDSASLQDMAKGIVRLNGPSETYTGDIIVLAVGPGRENTRLGSFVALPFWSNDELSRPRCGLPGGVAARVLIAGGGDGALQDYIRVLAGTNDLHHVAKTLFGLDQSLAAAVATRVWDIEDAYQRYFLHEAEGCQVHRRAHDEQKKLVQEYYSRFSAKLGDVINVGRLDELEDVKLAFSCTHFSWRYPINAFLALLFEHHLREVHGRETMLDRCQLASVAPADGHACAGDCWGKSHKVQFKPTTCEANGAPLAMSGGGNPLFNVILLRFGILDIEPASHLYFPRQLLPYGNR